MRDEVCRARLHDNDDDRLGESIGPRTTFKSDTQEDVDAMTSSSSLSSVTIFVEAGRVVVSVTVS